MPVRPRVCQNSVGFPDCSVDLRTQLKTSLPPGPLSTLRESQYLPENRPANTCGGRDGGKGEGREGGMDGGEKEGRNWYLCWVMNMLISLIVVILQCTCKSKHEIVTLKYIFFILSITSH